MNPRLRRLRADQERMEQTYRGHPRISIIAAEGEPAEKYVIEFRVESLVAAGKDAFERGRVHRAEVFLPLDYPRRAPFCRMVTPVFHPNIDPQKICIGDHWSAGEQLADLICRIGEMLTYQSYNIKSPLNAEAARWAEQNLHALPLEAVDLSAGGAPDITAEPL